MVLFEGEPSYPVHCICTIVLPNFSLSLTLWLSLSLSFFNPMPRPVLLLYLLLHPLPILGPSPLIFLWFWFNLGLRLRLAFQIFFTRFLPIFLRNWFEGRVSWVNTRGTTSFVVWFCFRYSVDELVHVWCGYCMFSCTHCFQREIQTLDGWQGNGASASQHPGQFWTKPLSSAVSRGLGASQSVSMWFV